jgi:hypothetical protein
VNRWVRVAGGVSLNLCLGAALLTLPLLVFFSACMPLRYPRDGEPVIRDLRVVDDREEELPELRGRFPALPEPLVTRRMSAE